jgi:hypothetical protein
MPDRAMLIPLHATFLKGWGSADRLARLPSSGSLYTYRGPAHPRPYPLPLFALRALGSGDRRRIAQCAPPSPLRVFDSCAGASLAPH